MANHLNVIVAVPCFKANPFRYYRATCDMGSARQPVSPPRLIMVAAMLPDTRDIRLINRTTEDLTDANIAGSDLIMTGGTRPQQWNTLAIVDLVHARVSPWCLEAPA